MTKRTTGITNKLKYGEDYYIKIGKKGGSAKYEGKKGFAAATREQRQAWGRKGGLNKKKSEV
jgi:general stress protein YciG